MSGPKIVDIRLLEAIQERQRRLIRERFKQLQKQWCEQRQRLEASLVAIRPMIPTNDITAINRSIAAMDQRFAELRDKQSLQELENRGTERLAFMNAELHRLQHQINDSVIEARKRARSMQAATNDLAARLRSAGMEEERRLLLMSPSIEALERAAKVLSRCEQEQASKAMQQALADLGVSASSRQLQPEARDPERERIEQLMVQLELLKDMAATGDLRARLDALDTEPDQRQRRLRLDSLALELSRELQQGNETAERNAILDELEAQLGVYEAVPAGLRQAIAAQREGQQKEPSLTDLRQAVERWCEHEARRLDGEHVRSVVLGSLRDLGYDVREGMQAGWVEGGSIVLHKAGSSDYAVELQDLNGRLRSHVVRFGDPDSSVSEQQRQRDTEIEEQWCTAHAQTLANLRQQGMEAQVMAKREPGEVPLVVVRSTDADHMDRSISRTNPPNQQQRS
jgi:hypothetical protein